MSSFFNVLGYFLIIECGRFLERGVTTTAIIVGIVASISLGVGRYLEQD